jgi:hypothetical protein
VLPKIWENHQPVNLTALEKDDLNRAFLLMCQIDGMHPLIDAFPCDA